MGIFECEGRKGVCLQVMQGGLNQKWLTLWEYLFAIKRLLPCIQISQGEKVVRSEVDSKHALHERPLFQSLYQIFLPERVILAFSFRIQ